MKPTTPTEVLEEQRKEETKAATNIEEAKELCARVIKQVSQSWEYLIDDKEMEKVTEQLHNTKA